MNEQCPVVFSTFERLYLRSSPSRPCICSNCTMLEDHLPLLSIDENFRKPGFDGVFCPELNGVLSDGCAGCAMLLRRLASSLICSSILSSFLSACPCFSLSRIVELEKKDASATHRFTAWLLALSSSRRSAIRARVRASLCFKSVLCVPF